MAAPWFDTQTRVEDGTNLLAVQNIKPDWIVSESYDNNINRPIATRDIPRAGKIWTEPGFESQIAGSGAAGTAPPEGTLFAAAGMAEAVVVSTSVTYTWSLTHATTKIAALSQFIGNGLKQPSTNCLLDAVFRGRVGAPLIAAWSGWGQYTAPTEATGSDTLGTKAVPIIGRDLTGTLASDSLHIREFDIALNNESNSPNDRLTGSSTTGVDLPDLVDSTPTLSLLAEIPAFSTENYYTDYTSGTTLALSMVYGASAGNILTITGTFYLNAAPAVEWVNKTAYHRLTADMGYDTSELLKFTFT